MRERNMMLKVAHTTLLDEIFEHDAETLRVIVAPWLHGVPRFAVFLDTYRSKIRRKIRLCRDAEARQDVVSELAVAWLLLRDRRFVVEYEKPRPDRKGGPDFAATFKTHTFLNVEAKRLRFTQTRDDGANRWSYAVCEKLRQLPPNEFNVVVLVVDGAADVETLSPAMKQLKLAAERKDEPFFQKRGLSAADFLTYSARLHGVAACSIAEGVPMARAFWLNKEVRRALPPDLLAALRSSAAML